MVIFYDLDTKEIVRTEDNTMNPILPANMTFEEQKSFYKKNNEGFISLPYEMGAYIFDYKLCFNLNYEFVGLQPINGRESK
jgi:hypothetical protein